MSCCHHCGQQNWPLFLCEKEGLLGEIFCERMFILWNMFSKVSNQYKVDGSSNVLQFHLPQKLLVGERSYFLIVLKTHLCCWDFFFFFSELCLTTSSVRHNESWATQILCPGGSRISTIFASDSRPVIFLLYRMTYLPSFWHWDHWNASSFISKFASRSYHL